MHICFYSQIPFVKKGPDAIIRIEVKSAGEHGISFCCPSIHKNKDPEDTNTYRYEIIGTLEPITLTKLGAWIIVEPDLHTQLLPVYMM
jgi:hypothetical protein